MHAPEFEKATLILLLVHRLLSIRNCLGGLIQNLVRVAALTKGSVLLAVSGHLHTATQ